ncbi:hypothetical protein GCM10010206_52030 [Streptomyces cinerochromogenes]|nr:hypothetical protein GCM10010206_52030 [Streptomyces cinerochromogenes]
MGVGGRRDDEAVHTGREQGLRRVRDLGPEPLGGGLGRVRERVGDDERLDGVEAGEGLGVEGADTAEAEDSDTHCGAAPRVGAEFWSRPPSTFWSQSITDPVTTPDRSDSRKTTKSAISSGWPSLPIGSRAAACSRQSSPAPWKARRVASSPSVAVQPIPCEARQARLGGDRAGRLAGRHVGDRRLHREERPLEVDRDVRGRSCRREVP